jgi:hypothetical protein
LSLPRRIYLDTSTLQTIHDFGEQIFDGVSFIAAGRAARVQGLGEEIDALRRVLLVNQRAMFELVVTASSLREVVARGDRSYLQWVLDVRETWQVQSSNEREPEPGTLLQDQRFGMISRKDGKLIQEALDWRCEAFLTMERRLPRVAQYLHSQTGLRLLRPSDYWRLLAPWSRLYY